MDQKTYLRSDNAERCGPQSSQEAFESASSPSAEVLLESICGAFPVPEAVRVSLRVSSDHGDEGEEEEHEDQNDLPARKPKLRFAISFDGEDVDKSGNDI